MNLSDAPQGAFGTLPLKTYFTLSALKLHQLLFHCEILVFAACASCWNTIGTLWLSPFPETY